MFVTNWNHFCNIQQSRNIQHVANDQQILQHLASAFTTKLIQVCYKFSALMQHPKAEEKTNVANDQKTLQHIASNFTTKLIHVCYILKTFMQHRTNLKEQLVANVQKTMQQLVCAFTTFGVCVHNISGDRMQPRISPSRSQPTRKSPSPSCQ